jgi:hypothetical protein
MDTKPTNSIMKAFAVAVYLVMIAVNALANILPINGVTIGQVLDAYPNLFAPAGLTFSIWGLIYVLLAAFTLYQFGLFQEGKPGNHRLLRRIRVLFIISSLANAAWIYSWHYRMIPLSMILMLVILGCLIAIAGLVRNESLSLREKLFIRLPCSVYFGWITVATIANATVLFVYLHWSGFGIPENVWAVIMIMAGMVIGVATLIINRDLAYGLVLVWAYAGIVFKHVSDAGFSRQYPSVIAAAVMCIVIFLGVLVLIQLRSASSRVS